MRGTKCNIGCRGGTIFVSHYHEQYYLPFRITGLSLVGLFAYMINIVDVTVYSLQTIMK